MRSFFFGLCRLWHAMPQRHSTTRDVSVTPSQREAASTAVDQAMASPIPVEPDPSRDAMARRIREHLKHLHADRQPTSKATE